MFFYLCFSWGEEPFLKEGFLPPTPPNSQELWMGVIFCFYTPADGWYRESCYKFRSTMPDFWLSALPTFFKEKVFPSPNPHLSKTLNVGCFFIFLHTCWRIVSGELLQIKENNARYSKFSPAFFKRRRCQGRGALVAHRNGRNFPYPSQNAGEGEFLCLQRKRENPRRGFSFLVCVYTWGEEPFLKEGFLPPTPPNS